MINLFSVVIKHQDQPPLGREVFIASYTFQFLSVIKRNQGSDSRQEPGGWN